MTIATVFRVGAQPAQIERLNPSDPLFRQHVELVAEYHRAAARGESAPPMVVSRYVPLVDDSLFALAARLMLPYATLATANRLQSPALPTAEIIVPSHPGIFVPIDPVSDLERAVAQRLESKQHELLYVGEGDSVRAVRFYPGADFAPEERARFLRIVFEHPLPDAPITSPFGYRSSPVSGARHFHGGVDFAAPFGTPVRAAAEGIVASIERDPILGLSLTINHRDGYQTLYAHLQRVHVGLHQRVNTAMMVGEVGSSGVSTGPHLHFEVRLNGIAQDPLRLLRTGRR